MGGPWTKRKILKVFPRLFDPLGFLLPYVMTARNVFSAVARGVANWDEKLAPAKLVRWHQWLQQLEELQQVRIPCCIKAQVDLERAELHVFTDASSESYATVAYLLTQDRSGTRAARMVMSRGKVAPPNNHSIPRLELMGARLGIQLGEVVQRAVKVPLSDIFYWTDSLNVLFWLRNENRRLQTFVDNKVRQIRSKTNIDQWKWVPTKQNPADLPTRGAGPGELARHELWWHGPSYLRLPPQDWPQAPRLQPCEKGLRELRKVEQVFVHFGNPVLAEEEAIFPFNRCGTWRKAVRVARLLLSWRARARRQPEPGEREGEKLLQKQIQLRYRQAMKQPTEGRLRQLGLHKLGPFLDEAGLLRGRGRLVHVAALSRDTREPLFLPREHAGRRLLIAHLHREDARHVGGVNQTLARLHEQFWMAKPRQVVFRVLQECIPCRRPTRPREGPLPDFRVPLPQEEPLAFTHTGMDCAGPFRVRRGRSEELHYLLLLTCC